jgi:hypothetical protein
MRPAAARLGMTLLGIYLIAVGIVPYLPAFGLASLVSLLAIATGVVILLGR